MFSYELHRQLHMSSGVSVMYALTVISMLFFNSVNLNPCLWKEWGPSFISCRNLGNTSTQSHLSFIYNAKGYNETRHHIRSWTRISIRL
uniref:Uncharacterized protein n=1 Tax=Arundo donax TaxID=35708 RepID=A0A0A9F561_ARUDO